MAPKHVKLQIRAIVSFLTLKFWILDISLNDLL